MSVVNGLIAVVWQLAVGWVCFFIQMDIAVGSLPVRPDGRPRVIYPVPLPGIKAVPTDRIGVLALLQRADALRRSVHRGQSIGRGKVGAVPGAVAVREEGVVDAIVEILGGAGEGRAVPDASQSLNQ